MSDSKENLNEFLNPKSMLTPGICGTLIMGMTNALGASFGVTGLGRSAISLGLSFLFGSLVFAGGLKSTRQKVVLYLLNSLFIFSMAAGTNSASQAAKSAASPRPPTPPVSLLHTQVVQHVVTNIHVLPNAARVHLVSTNFSTNVFARPLMPQVKPRPRFFEQWH